MKENEPLKLVIGRKNSLFSRYILSYYDKSDIGNAAKG